jgi:hypothetical protein
MKRFLPFFVVLILCSCEQAAARDTVLADIAKQDELSPTNKKAGDPQTGSTRPESEKHEDSLRNILLREKENTVLKESFLQEMYIRNVVTVSNDSLFVTLPFNVHGPDCGAPDCYSTDVSFGFRFGDTLLFPENIRFHEHERGCTDRERKLTGNFQLLEQTAQHVIYYSAEHKRTLVLFSPDSENGTAAYYFTGLGKNRITGQNVYDIMKEYDEEDKNAVYPFTSWLLTTNEYEHFMRR